MPNRLILAAFGTAALAFGGVAMASEYRVEKRFDLTAGGSFYVNSEAGGVVVRGVDGNQAVVVITSRREDFEKYYDVRFENPTADRLEVRIEQKNRGLFHFGSNGGGQVEVELPRQVAAEVHSSGGGVEVSDLTGKVRAESSGGGVHLSKIGGDVIASSSGGGVELVDVDGSAKLESSGGGIVARGIGGDVDASSSGGGVRIEEAKGAVVADSSGGPVRVTFAAGNAKGGDLGSSGGGVEARVDPSVGLEIDAHTSGGGLTCDVPVTVHGKISHESLRGQLNGGGALLKLRSSGGGITIEAR